ncbi:MAG: hypothetical protein KAI43_02825 [Candidatus Aureabacteria bacterium]|nr:hypothetical protein [Candidatus Auribacterota bacterium]
MNISKKLMLGYIGIALLIGIVGYLSALSSQKILQESIGDASSSIAKKTMEDIDKNIYDMVKHFEEYCHDLNMQKTIKASNKEFESLNDINKFIIEKNLEWIFYNKTKKNDFLENLLNNDLSHELRTKIDFYEKKSGYKVIGEVFVTNKYGAVVAL